MMIDISGVDLVKFVQSVYDLSSPVGMGFLNATPEPLSEEEAENIIMTTDHNHVALSMDYIKGRCCKMTVFKVEGGGHEIREYWADHSKRALDELIRRSVPSHKKG